MPTVAARFVRQAKAKGIVMIGNSDWQFPEFKAWWQRVRINWDFVPPAADSQAEPAAQSGLSYGAPAADERIGADSPGASEGQALTDVAQEGTGRADAEPVSIGNEIIEADGDVESGDRPDSPPALILEPAAAEPHFPAPVEPQLSARDVLLSVHAAGGINHTVRKTAQAAETVYGPESPNAILADPQAFLDGLDQELGLGNGDFLPSPLPQPSQQSVSVAELQRELAEVREKLAKAEARIIQLQKANLATYREKRLLDEHLRQLKP